MAIAFDASAGNHASGVSSLTYSHTCSSGANTILFVYVTADPSSDLVTGVTYNGVSMTLIAKDGANARWRYLFYLVAPASGANNVVISASSSIYLEGNSTSYTGASQTGVPDASQKNSAGSASSLTTSVTTIADNCWTVMGGNNDNGSLAAGTGSTLRHSDLVGGIFDSNALIHPAGSYSMTFTAGASGGTGAIMASFAPATASGKTFIPPRTSRNISYLRR